MGGQILKGEKKLCSSSKSADSGANIDFPSDVIQWHLL